ncbi:MAG TPA: hypothetical protein VKU41_33135, partial [Polyangiaceae bacterium]|nr:hypothetical protein [Polyangiaceae bacterium]
MPNKNVLALLSGLAALACTVMAVAWEGNPLAILGAMAAGTGAAAWGAPPTKRTALASMAIAAGSGGLFFHFDNFWGLFVAGLAFVWAA